MKTTLPLLGALATILVTGSWSYPIQLQERAPFELVKDDPAPAPTPAAESIPEPHTIEGDWHASLAQRHRRLKPRLFGIPTADSDVLDDDGLDRRAVDSALTYVPWIAQ